MTLFSLLLVLLMACLLLYRCLRTFGAVPRSSGHAASSIESIEKEQTVHRVRVSDMGKIFLLSLGLRLVLLAASIAAVMLQSDHGLSLGECFQRMQHWDAVHYANLVDKGYQGYTENGQHLFLVFFPGYVWLVRLIRLLIPNTVIAGIAVSSFCYAGGCCFLFKLIREYYDSQIAADSVVYLSLFPFSLFFGFVMTEGLFLLATTAACYYAHRGKWLLFGTWGFCAALTRMTGLLVIVPALIEWIVSSRKLELPRRKKVTAALRKVPALLMPLLGSGAYLLLNAAVDGSPMAFMVHQKHWYQGFMPLPEVMRYVGRFAAENLNTAIGWSIWLPTFFLFFAVLAVLLAAGKDPKTPVSLLAYAFCCFAATYSLSWLLSAGRYLSCCFPLFVFLAKLTAERPAVKRFLQSAEAVFLGIYLFAYLSGAQMM